MPGLSKHPLPHGFPAEAGGQHALRQTEERAPSGGPAEDGEREGPPGVKKPSHAHRMEGIQNINPEGKAPRGREFGVIAPSLSNCPRRPRADGGLPACDINPEGSEAPRGRGFASSCIHRLSAAAGDPAGLGFAAWMSALMVPTVGGPVRTGVCLNQNAVNSAPRRRPRTDGGLPLRGYASDRRQEDAPADGGLPAGWPFIRHPYRDAARTGVCRGGRRRAFPTTEAPRGRGCAPDSSHSPFPGKRRPAQMVYHPPPIPDGRGSAH